MNEGAHTIDCPIPAYLSALKRAFDIVLASIGLVLTWWLILIAVLLARIDTGRSGMFRQQRVGRYGQTFNILKIRTMRDVALIDTTVTAGGDPRITPLGAVFRRLKIDELPQLINVVRGDMSFVGPRPDVPGYADALAGGNSVVLSVRPGITGPATLKYKREEDMLADVDNPQKFNDEVIFPDKTRINAAYVRNYRFTDDLKYLWRTIFS